MHATSCAPAAKQISRNMASQQDDAADKSGAQRHTGGNSAAKFGGWRQNLVRDRTTKPVHSPCHKWLARAKTSQSALTGGSGVTSRACSRAAAAAPTSCARRRAAQPIRERAQAVPVWPPRAQRRAASRAQDLLGAGEVAVHKRGELAACIGRAHGRAAARAGRPRRPAAPARRSKSLERRSHLPRATTRRGPPLPA